MAVRDVNRGARVRIRTPEGRPRSQGSESLTKSASSADGVLASVATLLTAMRGGLEAVAAVAYVALKAQAAGLLV
jgi:hypothetical protein